MALLKPCPIKAIILDLQTPFKNGLQVVDEVRLIYRQRSGNIQLIEPEFAIVTSFGNIAHF